MPNLGRIYPFGYSTPNAMQRLQELMADETTLLVDTRLVPYAYNRSQWSRLGPQGLAKTWGDRYHFFTGPDGRNYLGNINYKSGGPVELVNAELGIKYLVRLLSHEWSVVLLCTCREFNACHRRVICELVKAQLSNVNIVL